MKIFDRWNFLQKKILHFWILELVKITKRKFLRRMELVLFFFFLFLFQRLKVFVNQETEKLFRNLLIKLVLKDWSDFFTNAKRSCKFASLTTDRKYSKVSWWSTLTLSSSFWFAKDYHMGTWKIVCGTSSPDNLNFDDKTELTRCSRKKIFFIWYMC